MHRALALAVVLATLDPTTRGAEAAPPIFSPCDELPAAVAVLGTGSTVESFALAPDASLAVASITAATDGGRSVLRFAKGGDAPEDVKLAGRVPGLSVTPDGKTAYAIVRVTDRKGGLRNVDLMRVDLETARASLGASLPATARGLALGQDGASLLVVSRDEIRTFVLPSLASGPLYRALGDNVGVAPLVGTSYVLLAQSSRVVIADLAAPQDRDGLVLAQEAAAPAPLRGLLSSTGAAGPLALSDGGRAWCVRVDAPFPAAPNHVEAPPPEPPPVEAPPAEAPPAEPPPAEPASAAAVAVVVPPPVEVPPVAAPPAETKTAEPLRVSSPQAAPGTVVGSVAGPAVADVAAIVLLGPDNVLHEAARAVPDEQGRYTSAALPPGSYRLVAAGKGGRVLICEPSFITLKVASDSAVEAPVLKILSAQ